MGLPISEYTFFRISCRIGFTNGGYLSCIEAAHLLLTLILKTFMNFGSFYRVLRLEEGIGGTEMTTGSEACQTELVFYKIRQNGGGARNIPDAKAMYEGLKIRFPGGKRKTGESEI